MKLYNVEFFNRWLNALRKFEKNIDALDETRRKLLLAALIVGVTLLCAAIFFVPAHTQRIVLLTQENQILKGIQALETVINNNKQAEENALKGEGVNLKKIQKKFAASNEIASLFREFIKENTSLKLVQLTALPPTKIQEVKPEGTVDFLLDGQAVYRTELTLSVSGSFNNVFSYLQKLEGLPWYFFWKSMSYQVTKYPEATVVLTLEVLSSATEKGV